MLDITDRVILANIEKIRLHTIWDIFFIICKNKKQKRVTWNKLNSNFWHDVKRNNNNG